MFVECEKCADVINGEFCNFCFDTGRVEAPKDMKVFVSAYKVTRHFGGHEEGGWYFNWYELIESVACEYKQSDEIVSILSEKNYGIVRGDIYSVRGGVDLVVLVEAVQYENETTERPHYE